MKHFNQFLLQDADKSAKKKAAAASLGGQQEMTPEQLQAEEEVRGYTTPFENNVVLLFSNFIKECN